ncbi:MAG: diacylglycerol/lipid kinase family protein [Candidatus Geothermincolia bacterium]
MRLLSGHGDKYLLVINPRSRMGKGLRKALWLISRLVIRRADFEAVVTRKPGHAEQIVAEFDQHCDVIVAIGGDGTVQEVINGLMRRPPEDRPLLAVVPAGRGNDFSHLIGVGDKKRRALKYLLAKDTTDVDLLRFNGRYAATVIGLGYDASVADRAQYYKVFPVTRYIFTALFLILKKPPKLQMTIEHEGGTWEGEFFIVVVGHSRKYARHVRVFPGMRIDGRTMKVAAIRPGPRIYALLVLASAAFGLATAWPQATVAETDWVEITPSTTVKAQSDGDVFYATGGQPLRIELVREALTVKTPMGNRRP